MTLALSLLVPATGSTPNVTLNDPPQSIEALLTKLSSTTGESLSVSNLLAREVVQVSVKDVPLDELLGKLSDVAGGTWVKTSSGRRLDLDTERARKQVQANLAARTLELKAEIDKLSKEVKSAPPLDPAKFQQTIDQLRQNAQNGQAGQNQPQFGQAFSAMRNQMPGSRAIILTLSEMKPEELAKVGPGQRVVFTTMPTPMQKPLPSTAVSIMKAFATDQAKWQSTMGAGRGGPRGQRPGPNGQPQPQAAAPSAPQTGPPYKAFLIATRFGGNGINLEYTVTDAQGNSLGSSNLTVGEAQPQQPEPSTEKSDQKPLSLSAETKLSLELLGRGGVFGFGGRGAFGQAGGPQGFGGRGPGAGGPQGFGGRGPGGQGRSGGAVTPDPRPQDQPQNRGSRPQQGGARQPFTPPVTSPEMASKLKDPVANEPLALTMGEVWTQVASTQGKNMVALLPDSLIGGMSRFLRTDHTADQILGAAKSTWNLDVQENGAWLTVAPKDLVTARDERIDRSAVKKLIDAVVKNGTARLDDIATYATKSPVLSSGSFDVAIVRSIDPASAQNMAQVYGENRDMLLMFAGMGSGTRQALDQGKTLAVSSAASNGVSLLADMVFNSRNGPRVEQPNSADRTASSTRSSSVPMLSTLPVVGALFQAQNGQNRGGRPGNFGGRGNMSQERTEILPHGVPGGAVVAVQQRTETVAKAVRKDVGLSQVMNSQTMAMEQFRAANPQQNANGQGPQRQTIAWDGYVAGNRYLYTFVFTLAPGVTITRSLEDTSFDPNSKPVSANELPQQFLAEVSEAQQNIEARRAQMAQRQQQGNQAGGRGRRQGRTNRTPPPA